MDLKEKVRKLPNKSGVYMFKDILGHVIYIGKALNLRKRVSQYFLRPSKTRAYNPKIAQLIDSIVDMDYLETKSEAQALILESKLIKEWKPKYNTLAKDNKNFMLLRVEKFSKLPRFTLVRNRKDDNSLYFGPYLSSQALRKTLNEIKKKFGILLSDATPKKLDDGKWQLYNDVRSQLSTFENIVSESDYALRVENALEFLSGKNKSILKEATQKMQEASTTQNYEKAAQFRDFIKALNQTQKLNKQEGYIKADISRKPKDIANIALKQLKEDLKLEEVPFAIECFDISHISGSFCVASMVRFEDGIPANNKYRRFQIKSFIGNDDFRAMEESVKRRYLRLANEGSDMPNIVLIDGGKGQVYSAMKALDSINVKIKTLCGLAKKEETIVLDDFTEIKLPRSNEGLKLLQRVRDEAHRFANSYSKLLRSKKIRESILDDFKGLGQARKDTLIKHFGSIKKLKNASVDEISQVKNIGSKTAVALKEFFNNITSNE